MKHRQKLTVLKGCIILDSKDKLKGNRFKNKSVIKVVIFLSIDIFNNSDAGLGRVDEAN